MLEVRVGIPSVIRAVLLPRLTAESVDLSTGVFGQCYLSGEPQRLMQDFINRKR